MGEEREAGHVDHVAAGRVDETKHGACGLDRVRVGVRGRGRGRRGRGRGRGRGGVG